MDVHVLQIGGALTVVLHIVVLSAAALEPYDLLYTSGVEALHRADYSSVVHYMEKALKSFSEVRQTKIRCGLKCSAQHELEATATDIHLFDAILRRAACLSDCIEGKIGPQSLHKVSEDVVQDFRRRTPYNYLQLAYLKLMQLDKAAAAAHTYFQANPEHVEMNQNLEYKYKSLEGVEEKHFVDQAIRPHERAFNAGVKLYDEGRYEDAVLLFEEALAEYYKADLDCRAGCEGPQHFREHDHLLYRYSLYELISDHYIQVLHCQHECVRDLATRPGRLSPMENYLPLHYDYLQFVYFQGAGGAAACGDPGSGVDSVPSMQLPEGCQGRVVSQARGDRGVQAPKKSGKNGSGKTKQIGRGSGLCFDLSAVP